MLGSNFGSVTSRISDTLWALVSSFVKMGMTVPVLPMSQNKAHKGVIEQGSQGCQVNGLCQPPVLMYTQKRPWWLSLDSAVAMV
jgi:hypothetical protein